MTPGSQQRGHVPLQVAALGCRATSPLSPVRRPGVLVSARGAAAPRAGAAEVHGQCFAEVGQSAVALGVGLASLRIVLVSQFHRPWCTAASAKLHNAPLPSVPASQSLKLLWWQPPLRALRVKAIGVMQNCLRWSGLVSRLHSPAASRLTCRRLPPLWCAGAWASVRRFAHCSGQWPAAMYLVRAPPTPFALPASRHRRAGCPSAPKGLPAVPRQDTPPAGGGLIWLSADFCHSDIIQLT